jgi:50S ribosomal protein L16 3-hydroxylase
MLYLPPGVAHHGVALEECLTYSIGFRAPSQYDLVAGFLQRVVSAVDRSRLYADPDLSRAREPGEISPAALARLRRIVASGSRAGTADFARFAGEHLTERRVDQHASRARPGDVSGLARALRLGAALVRRPDARVAFARRGRGALLFADGRHWTLPPALAPAAPVLTRSRHVASESLRPLLRRRGLIALLAELVSARVFRPALPGRRGSRRGAGSPRTKARS